MIYASKTHLCPLMKVYFQFPSSAQTHELCFWSSRTVPDFRSQASARPCRTAGGSSETPPEEAGCLKQFLSSLTVQAIWKYLLKTCTWTSAPGNDPHNEVPIHGRILLNAFQASCPQCAIQNTCTQRFVWLQLPYSFNYLTFMLLSNPTILGLLIIPIIFQTLDCCQWLGF